LDKPNLQCRVSESPPGKPQVFRLVKQNQRTCNANRRLTSARNLPRGAAAYRNLGGEPVDTHINPSSEDICEAEPDRELTSSRNLPRGAAAYRNLGGEPVDTHINPSS